MENRADVFVGQMDLISIKYVDHTTCLLKFVDSLSTATVTGPEMCSRGTEGKLSVPESVSL